MKPETKYKGSIKLSAIGDALGWITEFEKNTDSLSKKFGTKRIDSFHTWKKNVGGRFYGFVDTIKAGSYSDDTQLLLAVARSIKSDGTLDHQYFAKSELVSWRDYARGGGRTVKIAAEKIQRKSVNWFNNFYSFKINGENYDYRQSGANGAAMRVLPIALANLGNVERIKEEIFCNSIITHGHPRAILGAMLYGYAINQIIVYRADDFNWESFITQIGLDFPKKFELRFIHNQEVQEWLKEWNKLKDKSFQTMYDETVVETQNYLRFIYQSIKQGLSIQDTLRKLGCFDPSTKGSGTATVAAGIYLTAKFHDKPLQAVVEAVNALGSDTDSIAAFTGGLIGALHGHNIIPDRWKSVQDVDYLDKISDTLLAISENRFEKSQLAFASNLKNLNNLETDDVNIDDEIEFAPLGRGRITSIDRQPTVTKGKYNMLIEVLVESGQSILISKIFDSVENAVSIKQPNDSIRELTLIAETKLKPKTFKKLVDYLSKHKKISKSHIELLLDIIRDEE